MADFRRFPGCRSATMAAAGADMRRQSVLRVALRCAHCLRPQTPPVCMYVKIWRHQHTRVHAHTGPRRHTRAQACHRHHIPRLVRSCGGCWGRCGLFIRLALSVYLGLGTGMTTAEVAAGRGFLLRDPLFFSPARACRAYISTRVCWCRRRIFTIHTYIYGYSASC